MADHPAGPPQDALRPAEPARPLTAAGLGALTALHRRLLPWTASSRAGEAAVRALYEALLDDPAAVVLLAGDAERGAFAAGTVALRATSGRVQAHLRRRPAAFLRLAVRHLASPGHLLAARAFDALVPTEGAGYVLTIGAAPGAPLRGWQALTALEAALRARGARSLWVDTEAGNAAARRLYERAGYRLEAERHGQVLLRRPPPTAAP